MSDTRRRHALGYLLAAMVALAAGAVTTGIAATQEDGFTTEFMLDECDGFESDGENPYFSLEPGTRSRFEGDSDGEEIDLEIKVTGDTKKVDGVETRVIRETEKIDGELAEISRNYFAICNRDNSVVYFGEDVKFYEDGEVTGTEGSWLAGKNGAKPGIIMPGTVLVGAKYFQEQAPGVALDRAEHLRLDADVKTPAGRFRKTLKVEETTPLEPGAESIKNYAPEVGLVADGDIKLVETNAD